MGQTINGYNKGEVQKTYQTESGFLTTEKSNDFIPSKSQNSEWLFDAVSIGETQYDLQVNSSLGNRILLHDDGKVSTAFIMSSDGSPYSTRGTGYSHFNGTEWDDIPLNRLEPNRAGWGNIGTVEKNGKTVEFVVSHHWSADGSSTGGLYIMTNDDIGSGNFSVDKVYKVDANGPAWPRAVGNGKYIHIYSSVTTGFYQGIPTPNRYYRFDVETGEFDKERVLFDGYNADAIKRGQNDCYQMDVSGNTIAIVTGGSGQNLYLFKSTDNGDNWSTTVVDSFGIQGYNGNQTTKGDTLRTNTGSVEVLLDNNDNAHVWWAVTSILDDTENDSSWVFFPAANGIMHWNESNKTPQIVGRTLDINENDQLDLFSDQWSSNPGARYSNNSLACFPDAGIDADGNIFLLYSAPNEDALSPEGPVYRDVYVVYTEDDGVSWSNPQPIIENYEAEDVYAHIARNIDDKLHIIWQRDDYAGTAVINGHVGTLSTILYAGINKEDVLNDKFKINRTSIYETNINTPLNIFPNPTTASSFIQFNNQKNETASVNIYNSVGQKIKALNNIQVSEGQNLINLKTESFNKGVYLIQLVKNDNTYTENLIIK